MFNLDHKNVTIKNDDPSPLYFQRIRASVDESEQNNMLKELDVVMNSSTCTFIVNFYGAIFEEVSLAGS